MNVGAFVNTAIKAGLSFGKQAVQFGVKHAPVILTGAGTGLVIAGGICAYTSGKEVQAIECSHDFNEKYIDIRTQYGQRSWQLKALHLKEMWKQYVPPYALIGVGLACIWCGFHIHHTRLVAATGAIVAAESLAAAYSDQIAELVENGTATEKKTAHKIEENVAHQVASSSEQQAILGTGDTVFVDGLTGYVFRSTETNIRKAETEVLRLIADGESVSVGDFFRYLGIEHPGRITETYGWRGEPGEKKPDICFGAVYKHDGEVECIMRYNAVPLNEIRGISSGLLID